MSKKNDVTTAVKAISQEVTGVTGGGNGDSRQPLVKEAFNLLNTKREDGKSDLEHYRETGLLDQLRVISSGKLLDKTQLDLEDAGKLVNQDMSKGTKPLMDCIICMLEKLQGRRSEKETMQFSPRRRFILKDGKLLQDNKGNLKYSGNFPAVLIPKDKETSIGLVEQKYIERRVTNGSGKAEKVCLLVSEDKRGQLVFTEDGSQKLVKNNPGSRIITKYFRVERDSEGQTIMEGGKPKMVEVRRVVKEWTVFHACGDAYNRASHANAVIVWADSQGYRYHPATTLEEAERLKASAEAKHLRNIEETREVRESAKNKQLTAINALNQQFLGLGMKVAHFEAMPQGASIRVADTKAETTKEPAKKSRPTRKPSKKG